MSNISLQVAKAGGEYPRLLMTGPSNPYGSHFVERGTSVALTKVGVERDIPQTFTTITLHDGPPRGTNTVDLEAIGAKLESMKHSAAPTPTGDGLAAREVAENLVVDSLDSAEAQDLNSTVLVMTGSSKRKPDRDCRKYVHPCCRFSSFLGLTIRCCLRHCLGD